MKSCCVQFVSHSVRWLISFCLVIISLPAFGHAFARSASHGERSPDRSWELRLLPHLSRAVWISETPSPTQITFVNTLFDKEVYPASVSDLERMSERLTAFTETWEANYRREFFGPDRTRIISTEVRECLTDKQKCTSSSKALLLSFWSSEFLEDKISSSDPVDQRWMQEFRMQMEDTFTLVRSLVATQPSYFVILQSEANTILEEVKFDFQEGRTSESFRRWARVFSAFRSTSFRGIPFDWLTFENFLQNPRAELNADLVSFLIVLNRLQYQTPDAWRALALLHFRDRVRGKTLGVWGGDVAAMSQALSMDSAFQRYSDTKEEEYTQALYPWNYGKYEAAALTSLAVGSLIRSYTGYLKFLPQGAPIPSAILEKQMRMNPPGTYAHDQAKLALETQHQRSERAVDYAERHFGVPAGRTGAFIENAIVEPHGKRVDLQSAGCSGALMMASEGGLSMLALRKAALEQLTGVSPDLSKLNDNLRTQSKKEIRDFMNHEMKSNRWKRFFSWRHRRMQALFQKIHPRLGQLRIPNPRLGTGEKWSALIPGEIYRRTLLESGLAVAGRGLQWSGGVSFLTLMGDRVFDKAFGPTEPKRRGEDGEIVSDPLWEIAYRVPGRLALQGGKQVEKLIEELRDLESEINLEMHAVQAEKIEFRLNPLSASLPTESGKTSYFYFLITPKREELDPVKFREHLLSGIMIRFERVEKLDEVSSQPIIGWEYSGYLSLSSHRVLYRHLLNNALLWDTRAQSLTIDAEKVTHLWDEFQK